MCIYRRRELNKVVFGKHIGDACSENVSPKSYWRRVLWVSYIVLFDMDINMLITLPEHVDTKSRPQKNIMYCSLELLLKCIIFKYVQSKLIISFNKCTTTSPLIKNIQLEKIYIKVKKEK